MPLAYGGIVVSGIGDAVFWTGIREIGAYRPVIYDTLVPPVAIVIAVLILGQFFATLQTFGVSATLARLALMRLAPGRPSPWPE
jgi:drug/metabolite transporter (DMT)-like permease